MQEEWRPVVGHDGYEVSNFGKVRSLDRDVKHKDAHGGLAIFHYKGRELAQTTHTQGYKLVPLGRHKKSARVHQLVAQAFLPNPDKKPMINHKDGNPSNNCVENLEWCDNRENQLHALYVLGKDANKDRKKSVRCIETGEIFECAMDAARGNRHNANNIKAVANGYYGRKTCLGFHWEFIS